MTSSASNTFDTLSADRVSKVIQIHPSLQCNLTCRHCYSASAPSFKTGLDVYHLQQRTEELAAAGYNAISLSGGEPFLYQPLDTLLEHTHKLGFFNSITTNAMLLKSSRAKKILQYANLVAISIDGKEAQHDALRNQQGAFAKMEEGLRVVKDHVANYGFIHTLFPQNWELINWLVHYALEHGAGLLHLHPLELIGRASACFGGVTFDDLSLHKTYITFHVLKDLYRDQLFMQLDLLHREHIINNPSFVHHHSTMPALTADNFSTLFKEIIIDENGDILPIAHGCARHFKLGNIYSAVPCREMIEQFMQQKMDDIITLYRATHDHIVQNEALELINWSELVIQFSHALFGTATVGAGNTYANAFA